MNRRSFFKFAAFVATTNALDFGLNELQTIPPEPDHSELIDLIGYLKAQHRVICLGDTNHTDIDVASALKSVALAKGLRREGFGNLFIEYPAHKAQPFQDYQAKTISREDFIEALINNGGLSGWLWSKENEQLVKRLADMSEYIRVVPIDTRGKALFNDAPLSLQLGAETGKLGSYATNLFTHRSPLSAYVMIASMIIADMISDGGTAALMPTLLDDTKTAENLFSILDASDDKRGVIIYGTGHMDGSGEKYGVPSLYTALQEKGYTPASILIYPDAETREIAKQRNIKRYNKHHRPSCVDYLIKPANGSHLAFNDKTLKQNYLTRPVASQSAPTLTKQNLALHL